LGIAFALLDRLRGDGLFRPGTRVLDIGSSNLYSAHPDSIKAFIAAFRPVDAESATLADKLAAGSAYSPGTGGANNAFAGELLEHCGVSYLAFDIAKGFNTRVFDLNRETLPQTDCGKFDAVLNIGTTEHVLNQYNSFEVIHDACKVGGFIVHQLPAAGFTDHAYFIYTGRLFFDLAGYNGYEIVDVWYDGPTGEDDLYTSVRAYSSYFPPLAELARSQPLGIPNCALTIVYCKKTPAPFKACLEMSTSVGEIPTDVHSAYKDGTRKRQISGRAQRTEPRSSAPRLRRWWPLSARRSAVPAKEIAPQPATSPNRQALHVRAEELRGRLTPDPAGLDEIYTLYADYVAQNEPFPLDIEEHSLRVLLASVRPDDKSAAARLADVLRMQNKPVPAELAAGVRASAADSVPPQAATPTPQPGPPASDRTDVMQTLEARVRAGQPIPPELEKRALGYLLADDPSRVDLKRRLAAVLRLLNEPVPDSLLSELHAGFVSEEYAVDYQALLHEFGARVKFNDMEPEFHPILDSVRPYSMTTVERLYALWSSVRYLLDAGIDGDFVETGVWRGGSMMLVAREILRAGAAPRQLWLYDTFTGLPRPNAELDVDVLGNRAIDGWQARNLDGDNSVWAYADETEVRRNMASTGYPAERLRFVAGKVEATIPTQAPDHIAMLRIDTDWHVSYAHVLNTLYDRVVPGGVVLFDDYGHFLGARQAVDEFRRTRGIHQPLVRIDYSCRMLIKP